LKQSKVDSLVRSSWKLAAGKTIFIAKVTSFVNSTVSESLCLCKSRRKCSSPRPSRRYQCLF